MLMSSQGVPDEVFMYKLKKAIDLINVDKMLKKLYKSAKDVLVQA